MGMLEKKLKSELGKIHMRASERIFLRERLLAYMEYHDRKNFHASSAIQDRVVGFFADFYASYLNTSQARGAFGVVALLVVVSIPFSAESSVPGDVLYPVKVRVNEEVRSGLTFSPYEKVAWEAKRAERRIGEARVLAKEGRLTNEVEAELTETMKGHVADAQKEMAVLRESDADGAAIAQVAMESALELQTAVLDTDISTQASSSVSGESHMATLALAVRDVHASLVVSEPEVSVSAYDRFTLKVAESMKYAKELESSLLPTLTEGESFEINRRLSDIENTVSAAHTLHASSTTQGGLRDLKSAFSDIQKLIAFMSDIEVRRSVAIEKLVPKQLTDEDRKEILWAAHAELLGTVELVSMRLASSTAEQGVRDVQSTTIAQLQEQLDIVSRQLEEGGSLNEAEFALNAARVLSHTLLGSVDQIDAPVDEAPVSEEATSTPPQAL
jgi:hypothetical protein